MTRRSRPLLITTVALALALAGCASAPAPAASQHSTPPTALAWVKAWNGDDPAALGALFTSDASYRDVAVMKTSRGPAGITAWKRGTGALIDGAAFDLDHAFEDAGSVAIVGTYRGRITSAPRAFAVPMVAVLRLRGTRIVRDTDYYNLSEVLRQSGLPPTWTPPSGPKGART